MRQHAKALDFGSGVAELERLVATEFSPTGQRRPSNAGIKATGAKLPVPPLVPPCLSRLRKPGGLVFKTEGDRRTNLLLHCGWSLAKQAAKGFSLHTWRNRKRIALCGFRQRGRYISLHVRERQSIFESERC